MLLADVARLCNGAWSEPIVRTLRDIHSENVRAVLFGGTLRSLLLSRLRNQGLGRPRDIDIVVAGVSLDTLRERFRSIITRETRFGGLKLERMEWQFDVWPIHRTWAFLEDQTLKPCFATLPHTTFFNIEAIAVDIWESPGRPRTIYSGDDQFFEGIISQIIEINRQENPFPSLSVVRALVMASSMRFAIGPRLARYLVAYGSDLSDAELEEVQLKHYDRIYRDAATIRKWLRHVSSCYTQNSHCPITLPMCEPLDLWSSTRSSAIQLHLSPQVV